jgi:3-methyladenine DNA glycosylase/8-oxoguanine DNA glycosylase
MTHLKLSTRPPFSLHSVVHSHGWVQLAPFRENESSSGFSYVVQLDDGKVTELAVSEEPGGVLVSSSEELNQAEQEEISLKIRWMLDLDRDFSSFYTLTRSEPKLAKTEGRAQGRVLRSATFFEDVVKTILTTNTVWGATRNMSRALVEHFGAPLLSDANRRAFPLPQRLALVEADELRLKARLGYRAPYVHELAQRVVSGDLDLEAFKSSQLPTPEFRKQLMAIKGVGKYASANLLMLLGRYDFLTIDSWALKMVSQEFYAGQPVGEAEVQAAFEKWGEWKGLAYWFWDWKIPT